MEQEYEVIHSYFTEEDWKSMCEYEKHRYLSIYDRYKNMTERGLELKTPEFMTGKHGGIGESSKATDNAADSEENKENVDPKEECKVPNGFWGFPSRTWKTSIDIKKKNTVGDEENIKENEDDCIKRDDNEDKEEEMKKGRECVSIHECYYCGKGFIEKEELRGHMSLHGYGVNDEDDIEKRKHKCDTCGKKFKRKDTLNDHMLVHTGERPFQCELCNKAFNLKRNLNIHMLIHKNIKKFKCEFCNKSFVRKQHLEEHIRIHTKEKPFICTVCDKGFTQNSNLIRHMRVHTKETPYACKICGKQFNQNSSLKNHILTHTNESPYKCGMCSKRFNVIGNCRTHEKICRLKLDKKEKK